MGDGDPPQSTVETSRRELAKRAGVAALLPIAFSQSSRGAEDSDGDSERSGEEYSDGPETESVDIAEQLLEAIATDAFAATVSDQRFVGNPAQAAVFTDSQSLLGFPQEGSEYGVVSTGDAQMAPGSPFDFASMYFSSFSESGLLNPTNNPAFDVGYLSLTVDVPDDATTLQFDYRFATEELPAFFKDPFQDYFTAEVVEPDNTRRNIATLPGGEPVTVDNAQDYASTPSDVVFNRVTDRIPVEFDVEPYQGETLTLKLGVADVSDNLLDSAVFLDALRYDASGLTIEQVRPVQTVFNTGLSDDMDLVAGKQTAVLISFRQTAILDTLTDTVDITVSGKTIQSRTKTVDAAEIKAVAKPPADIDRSEDYIAIHTRAATEATIGTVDVTVTPSQDDIGEVTTSVAARTWGTGPLDIDFSNVRNVIFDDGEQAPRSAYLDHYSQSTKLIQATYPIRQRNFRSSSRVSASIRATQDTGTAALLTQLAEAQYQKKRGEFLIGVLSDTNADIADVKAGLTQSNLYPVAFARIGYWSAAAHEIGHQYGLYRFVEEYDSDVDDSEDSEGYWPAKRLYIGGPDLEEYAKPFMWSGSKEPDFLKNPERFRENPGAVTPIWINNVPNEWSKNPIGTEPQVDQADFDVIFKQLVSEAPTSTAESASATATTAVTPTEDTAATDILYIRGTVAANEKFRARGWSFYPDDEPRVPGDGAYAVVGRDADGEVVRTDSFAVSFDVQTVAAGVSTLDDAPVALAVPFPEAVRTVEIQKDGRTLARYETTVELLRDAIRSIPDRGFETSGRGVTADQRRTALLNKVDAIERMLDSDNESGATRKLARDLRPAVKRWVTDDYDAVPPIERSRDRVLVVIDALIDRLGDNTT